MLAHLLAFQQQLVERVYHLPRIIYLIAHEFAEFIVLAFLESLFESILFKKRREALDIYVLERFRLERKVEGIAAYNLKPLLLSFPAQAHVNIYSHEQVPFFASGLIQLRVPAAAYFKDGVRFYHNQINVLLDRLEVFKNY